VTILDQLVRDEDEVLHLYYDSVGKPTIGVGCNLDVRVPNDLCREITITAMGSRRLLELRAAQAVNDVAEHIPWSSTLDEARRGVLVNMVFNMGIGGVLRFRKMLDALEVFDFVSAAAEMRQSVWYQQVGDRAKRLETQMLTGLWQ